MLHLSVVITIATVRSEFEAQAEDAAALVAAFRAWLDRPMTAIAAPPEVLAGLARVDEVDREAAQVRADAILLVSKGCSPERVAAATGQPVEELRPFYVPPDRILRTGMTAATRYALTQVAARERVPISPAPPPPRADIRSLVRAELCRAFNRAQGERLTSSQLVAAVRERLAPSPAWETMSTVLGDLVREQKVGVITVGTERRYARRGSHDIA